MNRLSRFGDDRSWRLTRGVGVGGHGWSGGLVEQGLFSPQHSILRHHWSQRTRLSRNRDSSVVSVLDSWSKGPGFKSPHEWWENFVLQGQLSVLILISVSIPPHVTTVAYKKSQSFHQKCRWQVTAKLTHTSYTWLGLSDTVNCIPVNPYSLPV